MGIVSWGHPRTHLQKECSTVLFGVKFAIRAHRARKGPLKEYCRLDVRRDLTSKL